MLYTFSSLAVLLFILYLLVSNPSFQTRIAQSFASNLSAELKTEIKIEKLKIRFFKTVVLEGLLIRDKKNDTLLYSESINLHVAGFNIRKQFVNLAEINIYHAKINLRKYKGQDELNLQFLMDYIIGDVNDTTPASPWSITTRKLNLKNCSFRYEDYNKPHLLSGLDYNYMVFSKINLSVNKIRFVNDTIFGNIKTLDLHERSGFVLNRFSGDAKVSPIGVSIKQLRIRTPASDLDMDMEFRYNGYAGFLSFIDSVTVTAQIRNSSLNLSDIGYFAPVMSLSDDEIFFSAEVKGLVSSFKVKDLVLKYGKYTNLKGNFSFTGLPDFYNTYINATISELNTRYEDVADINLPPGGDTLALPVLTRNLGDVSLNGKFAGFPNDFHAKFSVTTEKGEAGIDLSMKNSNGWERAEYKGTVSCNNLLLDELLDKSTGISELSLVSEVNGRGLSAETASLSVTTYVSRIVFRGKELSSLELKGNMKEKIFNGLVAIHNHKIDFEVNGLVDLSNVLPKFRLTGDIRKADLHYFGIAGLDSAAIFSGQFEVDLIGNKPDNMQGMIKAQNITYIEKRGGFKIAALSVVSTQDPSHYRIINVYSDILDGSIQGNFSLSDLPGYLAGSINRYSNRFIEDGTIVIIENVNQDFVFNFNIRNINPILEIFFPPLHLYSNTVLSGEYDYQQQKIKLLFTANKAKIAGILVKDLNISVGSANGSLSMDAISSGLFINDTVSIDNFKLNAVLNSDTVNYKLSWQNVERKINNVGLIGGKLWFRGSKNLDMIITDGNFFVKDNLWTLNQDNFLSIDSSEIKINHFEFSDKDESLLVDGVISVNPDKLLKIEFKNFNVSNLDDLTSIWLLDFDGVINGDLVINDLYRQFGFKTNLRINDLFFNKEKLGEAEFITLWDDKTRSLEVNTNIIYTGNIGSSKVLRLTGKVHPFSSNEMFDIDMELNNFKLYTLAPYLKDFSSGLQGMASGNLHLGGSSEKTELLGELSLMRTQFKIDYLNTTYSLAEKLHFDRNRIHIDNGVLYDSLNNKAYADLNITHNFLKDFKLDLTIKPEKLSCLNTNSSQNPVFYGSGFATGEVNISGPFNNILIDVKVSTDPGTELYIPINMAYDLSENSYIIFKKDTVDGLVKQREYEVKLEGLDLNMNIDVDPDAELQLFLPYRMGTIRGSGQGKIKMSVNKFGNFEIDGDYYIYKGDFLFTLQNIFSRHLVISQGSKISFSGSPYDAEVNISATYKIKTTLGDLSPEADYNKSIPVNCIIQLKEKLFDPQIYFRVEFPTLDEQTRQNVYARLDTNNQVMMSQQVISLLVANSFVQSSGMSGNVNLNSFGMISNQLNNWLSRISKDFDIGVNYLPGDEMTSQQFELAMSTQLLNNRVLIDGNLGMTGDQNTSNTSNIVGEVNVELLISEDGKLRAKAFNKSNNDYLLKGYAPYTQGVGFSFRHDFDRLSEIFCSRKKNRNPVGIKTNNVINGEQQ